MDHADRIEARNLAVLLKQGHSTKALPEAEVGHQADQASACALKPLRRHLILASFQAFLIKLLNGI